MRNLIALCVLALMVSITSCKKVLDKTSYADYNEELLKRPEGIKAVLNGVYDMVSSSQYYGCNIYAYEAAKGPDFFVRRSTGGNFEIENRYAEDTNQVGAAAATWNKIYATIRTATTVLEYIDQTEGLTQSERERITGEAKALRALAYFDLMRLFAYPPRYSMPSGSAYNDRYKMGVPIIRNLDMVNNVHKYEIKREDAEVVYAYIEDDFKEAKTLLFGKAVARGNIGHMAVAALMSRLYLYLERWDDVIDMGEEALSSAQNKFSYIPYASYKTNYYRSYNSENIWELPYSVADNLGSSALNYIVRRPTNDNPGGADDGQVSQLVGYAAYGLLPLAQTQFNTAIGAAEDVRKYLICELGVSTNPEYRSIRKYVGEPYHFTYNLPMVRLPEIHLNIAEAYLAKSDVVNAEPYYTFVRLARTTTSGFGTTDIGVAKTALFAERRREFILEGHTYWDYARRGISFRRIASGSTSIENTSRSEVVFPAGTHRVVYPIPYVELQSNPAMRTQQNPNYTPFDRVITEQ